MAGIVAATTPPVMLFRGECRVAETDGMGKVLKRLGAGMAVLLLGVAVLYLVSWQLAPGAEERQALALLQTPSPPADGADGFAALWSLPYRVPAAERDQVLRQDVERFARIPLSRSATASRASDVFVSAASRHPAVEVGAPEDPAWCRWRENDCLAVVRAAMPAYEAMLQRNATLLANVAELAVYAHFRNPFPPRPDMPLPSYQPLSRSLTGHAHAFASGDREAALAGVCADASTARRLISGSHTLIGSVIGSAMLEGNASLFAGMLAELPRQYPLPASCDDAFAPMAALHDDICQMMLGEGRYVLAGLNAYAAIESDGGLETSKAARAFYDRGRTEARMAPRFAWYCGEAARSQLVADLPLHDSTPSPSRWTLACISNATGCILADIGGPDLDEYAHRLQDANARLRMITALLWLRRQQAGEGRADLSELPRQLRGGNRELRIEQSELAVAAYARPTTDKPADTNLRLPLPGSRLP